GTAAQVVAARFSDRGSGSTVTGLNRSLVRPERLHMTSTVLHGDPALRMPVEVRGYDINLGLHSDTTTLTLAGDLDAAATDALRGLLTVVHITPSVIHVHADGVLGADLEAFDPLLEAARARRAQGLPSVRVESLGDAVRDLFGVLGLREQPPVVL